MNYCVFAFCCVFLNKYDAIYLNAQSVKEDNQKNAQQIQAQFKLTIYDFADYVHCKHCIVVLNVKKVCFRYYCWGWCFGKFMLPVQYQV